MTAMDILIGLDEAEVVGRTVHEIFPKERADFFEQKDRDVFALGSKITTEREQMLSSKGQRWMITSFHHDEAERILGYPADEVIGQRTLAAFHDRIEMDRVAMRLAKTYAQFVPVDFETIAFRAARGQADG